MNVSNFLKKITPAVVLFVVILGALNVGSYDPYNELTVLAPDMAMAQASLAVPSLTTPSFSSPTLSVPTVTAPTIVVPEVVEPVLEVPSVSTPTLSVPEVTTPVLSVPSLSNNQALTVPTLTSQSLTVPSLTVPGITIPALSGSSSSQSGSYTTTFKSCDVSASAAQVQNGSSVTISWQTQGYSNVRLNGVPVNASGSQSFTIQTNTTYTLVATNNDGKPGCTTNVSVTCVAPLPPKCTLTPATRTINSGESVTLAWTTENAASANLSSFGAVELVSGTRNTGNLTTNTNYELTVVGTNGDTVKCHSNITVVPKEVKYCELTLEKSVSSTTANPGDELTYTVKIKNTGTADCTGGGVKIVDIHDDNIIYLSETHTANLNAGYEGNPVYVPATKTIYWNGNTLTPGEEGTIVWKGKVKENLACDTTTIIKNTAKATARELSNFSVWAYSNTVETSVHKTCHVPVASCDAFTASPTTITRGDSATLTWATTNATRVVIDQGFGEVTPTASGTRSITPLATTTYTLTAYGVGDQKDTCTATVIVKDIPVVNAPKCVAFTATPTSLPVGGGNVTLAWTTTNATGVSIAPTIGSVAVNGSTTIGITATQTFTLTTTNASSSDSCVVTVPVEPPVQTPLTCAANVTLSASPDSITRGGESTLTWTTTGITSLSFNNGITATGLSGSTTVSPTDSTTYILTASNGTETINCPVPVTVRTGGGGGGGSSSPRCELSISDNKINPGDRVVLTWESTRATDITLVDKTEDETLVTTSGLLKAAKDRLLDGKITVSPERDTTYELTVKRGSTTRKCTVDVEMDDNIVITEVRDQPLVAGIALTQVPYTGFEAGPILTLLFYTLLMAWALYVAYLLVIKRDALGGLTFARTAPVEPSTRFIPEQVRPDVFVANVKAPEMPISTLPTNLPTGTPAVGYVNHVEDEVVTEVASHQIDDSEMTMIENHAHAQHVLLSSDAIRHFIATTNTTTERTIALDQVLVAAKAQFPAEDGWVVLNEKRMQELCVVCAVNAQKAVESTYTPAVVPQGAGSLAEAVVTGNVVAAYELIGNRPMFALADAAADLDSVYRIRRGIEAKASELLMKETANLTNEQILKMIEALTGALDGAYNDEASAVKMAIMKAIKVVA